MIKMLETMVCGIKLENPTILASGIMGSAGSSLRLIAKTGGAGAVVTKSIGVMPQKGHKNPTIVELDCGLINAIGLAGPGYREFSEEIATAKKGGVPVIASIFGYSASEFVAAALGMAKTGIDAIEINLSCPNVKKAGTFYGQNPDLTYEVVKDVKDSVKIPVIAKLTANVESIAAIAGACIDAGCDGITAINTLKAMKIDINTGRPILANATGGLSGGCIKPIAIRCVYEIAKEFESDIDIIGCGGAATGRDVIEFLMAGAKAVQIGTGVYSRGIDVFRKVTGEIELFMKDSGYKNIEELVGAAL